MVLGLKATTDRTMVYFEFLIVRFAKNWKIFKTKSDHGGKNFLSDYVKTLFVEKNRALPK